MMCEGFTSSNLGRSARRQLLQAAAGVVTSKRAARHLHYVEALAVHDPLETGSQEPLSAASYWIAAFFWRERGAQAAAHGAGAGVCLGGPGNSSLPGGRDGMNFFGSECVPNTTPQKARKEGRRTTRS